MIVKVATFRNAVDHLFRVVNVDYQGSFAGEGEILR